MCVPLVYYITGSPKVKMEHLCLPSTIRLRGVMLNQLSNKEKYCSTDIRLHAEMLLLSYTKLQLQFVTTKLILHQFSCKKLQDTSCMWIAFTFEQLI